MTVTVQLTISPHPQEDVEKTLRFVATKLTPAKDSIKIIFPDKDSTKVLLQFWMPDKSHYKVVDEIAEHIKMACWQFYQDNVISFQDDRKRKSKSECS